MIDRKTCRLCESPSAGTVCKNCQEKMVTPDTRENEVRRKKFTVRCPICDKPRDVSYQLLMRRLPQSKKHPPLFTCQSCATTASTGKRWATTAVQGRGLPEGTKIDVGVCRIAEAKAGFRSPECIGPCDFADYEKCMNIAAELRWDGFRKII